MSKVAAIIITALTILLCLALIRQAIIHHNALKRCIRSPKHCWLWHNADKNDPGIPLTPLVPGGA